MKKKLIFIIAIILIAILGVMIYFYMKEKSEVIEYEPQEEITDEQMRQTIVSLYYKNKETGELMPEGRLIDVKELITDPYKLLVEMLIETPKSDKLESAIPKGTVVNKTEVKKDVLYLDLSKEFINNHPGGEKAETTTIYSMVNTLTELTEVNSIKILIDGKENESFKDNKVQFNKEFTRMD